MTATVEAEKKLTVREFREMDFPENDPFIYELINGELVRKQAPSPKHQETVAELIFLLKTYLKANPNGRIFPAPTDVFLDENNNIQPDISFVSEARDFLVDDKNGILGTPDLIMEIISPGNVRRDRVTKMELYERFAVREYWLIDPNNRTVEIYVMRENRYAEHQFLEAEGKAISTVMTGFELEIKDLFGG